MPNNSQNYTSAVSMLALLLETGNAMHGEKLSVYAENYPYWDWNGMASYVDLAKGLQKSGYGDSLGWKLLREHLAARDADRRSWPFLSLDNIAVTQGGTHAVYSILQAFGGPQSDVLLPAPGYTGYRDICRSLRLQHRPYAVNDSAEWPTDEILGSLGSSSIIVVNSPHNPSGNQIGTPQLTRLVHAARRVGALVVFDLVYDDLVYEGDSLQWNSIFRTEDDLASCIWVNSFSKNYGFPALRMGWITASVLTVRKLEPVLESTILCLPFLNQELALAVLRHGSSALVSEMKRRRNFLCSRLASIPDLEFKCPAAGLSVMARLRNGSAIDLVQRLLEQRAVLFLPGDAYYCGDPRTIRLSFGYSPAKIEKYTSVLAEVLRSESLVRSRGVGRWPFFPMEKICAVSR